MSLSRSPVGEVTGSLFVTLLHGRLARGIVGPDRFDRLTDPPVRGEVDETVEGAGQPSVVCHGEHGAVELSGRGFEGLG